MPECSPLISIVVPVYNVEAYLEKCVRSILAQSYENLQVILIDDGSSDGSAKICDDLRDIDHRIEVFHTENGGPSRARNFGMTKVKGDYVLFVDADDHIGKKHVSNLLDAIVETGSLLSITTCTRFTSNDEDDRYLTNTDPTEVEVLDRDEALLIALAPSRNSKFQEHLPGKLYHKELYPYLKLPEGKKYEDRFVCYLILCQCEKVVYENAGDYYYLDDRTGSTTNTVSLQSLDNLEATRTMMPYLKQHAPRVFTFVKSRYAGELIGSYLVAKQIGRNDIAQELYREIKTKRQEILRSSSIPLSTRLGFALTYLGQGVFTSAVLLNAKRQ